MLCDKTKERHSLSPNEENDIVRDYATLSEEILFIIILTRKIKKSLNILRWWQPSLKRNMFFNEVEARKDNTDLKVLIELVDEFTGQTIRTEKLWGPGEWQKWKNGKHGTNALKEKNWSWKLFSSKTTQWYLHPKENTLKY